MPLVGNRIRHDTAGTPVIVPDGANGSRTSTGTSRATFDSTEQAAWTVAAGGSALPGGATGQVLTKVGDGAG
jgi:hypothetical protein